MGKAVAAAAGRRAAAGRGGPGRRVRLRGKTAQPSVPAPLKALVAGVARAHLPALHRHTRGMPFGPRAWRSWLRHRLSGGRWKLPTEEEASRLLQALARPEVWRPLGTRYIDPESTCDVSNIRGFESRRGNGSTKRVSWHEYGTVYRVRKAGAESKGGAEFQITSTSAFRRLGCSVSKKSLEVKVGRSRSEFKGSVVFEPCRRGLKVENSWTLIYLHSFSCKGTDYLDFPHYFGIGGAAVRVVIPTAPLLEQACFKDWNVWRGWHLGWRRIKFRAWFDYLTDKAGTSENELDLRSLLDMRSRLHALIKEEVKRQGGDARRVILGGASQGCCVALDAAMTYPEELGGVVGLVGHILSCTPLDLAKRSMPLHLFHETTDKEMRWSWVKDTVQRLVDAGFNVTSKREKDPSGSGHWIQEIEGRWIRSALREITAAGSCAINAV